MPGEGVKHLRLEVVVLILNCSGVKTMNMNLIVLSLAVDIALLFPVISPVSPSNEGRKYTK